MNLINHYFMHDMSIRQYFDMTAMKLLPLRVKPLAEATLLNLSKMNTAHAGMTRKTLFATLTVNSTKWHLSYIGINNCKL